MLYLMCSRIILLLDAAPLGTRNLERARQRLRAMAAYTVVLVLCSIAFNALWWYAAAGGRLSVASMRGRGGIQGRHGSPVVTTAGHDCVSIPAS